MNTYIYIYRHISIQLHILYTHLDSHHDNTGNVATQHNVHNSEWQIHNKVTLRYDSS